MELVAILDCGAQYTKIIDRKVRELGVCSDIFPLNVDPEKLRSYGAIILSGGPASVYDATAPQGDPKLLELSVPVLGICFGMHWINDKLGGTVSQESRGEYGSTQIQVDTKCPLFDSLEENQTVLMSHGDTATALAPNLQVCARSDGICAGFWNPEKKIYGVQFHPEVDLSVHGMRILENFLRKVAGFKEQYSLEDRIQTAIREIQDRVGNEKILVLVSGGVDSAVSAALLIKALPPENVYAIHVDHGFMRLNESDRICEALQKMGLVHLMRAEAQDFFFDTILDTPEGPLGPLTSLNDPEKRRHLIGTLFVKEVQKYASQLGLDFSKTFWAQGTLRPDLIESGNPEVSGHANRIKTHHNDVDLVRSARERGLVIETNRDWHKDEVRKVALMLGIPEEVAYRQPFPGPGLAVRLMGYDDEKTTEEQKSTFAALLEELAPRFQGETIPIKTVGVQGDHRSYRYFALLHGTDFAADWKEMGRIAGQLPNRLNFINRVVYRLNPDPQRKPLRCFPRTISRENVELLRQVDARVGNLFGKNRDIAQSFAVLLPMGSEEKPYSIVIRAVCTNDFMTGRPARLHDEIPEEAFRELVTEIVRDFPEIECVAYDFTEKPPATVEWM